VAVRRYCITVLSPPEDVSNASTSIAGRMGVDPLIAGQVILLQTFRAGPPSSLMAPPAISSAASLAASSDGRQDGGRA
jgi:hypothetical protein